MDFFTNPDMWVSLLTLTLLEIVLGVDNIVFISILAGKLPAEQQSKARNTGLMLALVTRILLLCTISFLMGLTKPWFDVFGHPVSGKDLILILGGLFLIWKSVHEIHEKLEGDDGEHSSKTVKSFKSVVLQILLIDIVFSLDSVITAVGLASDLRVMIAAVILSMLVMLASAGVISDFVNRHPTVKMLALSFLLMIGVVLVGEGIGKHIEKGMVYFAMAFSVAVEMLNLKMRSKKTKPVELHQPYR